MEREQAMVREFQRAFDHPVNDRPVKLTPDRVRARAGWMHEEVREFEHATTLDEQVDAMIDLMYFALGTMVELGVEGAPVFEIVHRANMKKLGPDGKPMLRDGDRHGCSGALDRHEHDRGEPPGRRPAVERASGRSAL